ncbi:MAG TPA: Asp23/Gls24 family envelope stress response protein [Candidatus Limnocylindrales bacterium]|jgi:uncharacterized alkaline shock family protein YloU
MDGRGPEGTTRARTADPLTVSHSVIVEMVRVATLEVPGVLKVGRGGPLAWLAGSPVRARLVNGRVSVRVWVVARPGHALSPLAAQVRQAVGATIERLLDLEPGEVTVVVDGVEGRGK